MRIKVWSAVLPCWLLLGLSCDQASPRASAREPDRQQQSALPVEAGSAPAGLPRLPDWGAATTNDAAEVAGWPELPSGQGWARYLGQNLPEVLGIGRKVVVCGEDRGVTAYRLEDGEPVWSNGRNEIRNWLPRPGLSQEVLIGQSLYGKDVIATDLADGRQLWTRSGVKLLAVGSAGAWVAHLRPAGAPIEQPDDELSLGLCSDLLLLEPQTGKEILALELGRLFATVSYPAPGSSTMAVATSDELLLCDASGILARVPRPNRGWQSELALDDQGLLEIGHPAAPPYAELRAQFEKHGEFKDMAEWQKFIDDTPYGQAMGQAVIQYFSCPALKLVWSGKPIEQPTPEQGSGAGLKPVLGPELALGLGYQNAIVRRRSDGQTAVSPLPMGDHWRYQAVSGMVVATDDEGLYGDTTGNPLTTEPTRVYLLGSGISSKLPPPPTTRAEWLFAGAGYACWVTRELAGKHWEPPGAAAHALVCLKVDGQLQPLPGEPLRLNGPEAQGELLKDFSASAAPVQDARLMRRVVAADSSGWAGLLADVENPPQLEALLRAANYREAQRAFEFESERALVSRLVQLGSKAEPLLVRLAAEDQMSWLRPVLETALFKTQGTVARDYIKRTYALTDPMPLPLSGPPWPLSAADSPLSSLRKEPELTGGYDPVQWATVTDPQGGSYTAFTGFCTAGETQVLLGFDEQADGSFEWIAPTGLVDDCCTPRGIFRGLPKCFDERKQLTLALALPEVVIGHHSGQYAPADEYGQRELTGAVFAQTRLTLDAIRRDSDGDGLTDTTEALLLLDPHQVDSDRDGLTDDIDPAPNAATGGMDRFTRGLARMLQARARQAAWNIRAGRALPSAPALLPFDAVYIRSDKPIAAGWEGRRAIYVTTEAQLASLGTADPRPAGCDLYLQEMTDEDRSFVKVPGTRAVQVQSYGSDAMMPPDLLTEIDGEYYPLPPLLSY
jgi:hypothetical protein